MRLLHCLRFTKAMATALVVFCVVAALVPTVASAETSPTVSDEAKETTVCGSVGSTADDGRESSGLGGLVDGGAASAGGVVAQVAEDSVYDDSALNVLSEHTRLLGQSADVDPVVVDGKLDPGCGVAFVLGGVEEQVGAVGVTGLEINDDSRWLVQGLDGRRGYRMMAVLENSRAVKSYTVGVELDDDVSLMILDNGGAVFVNSEDLVIGSILAPWALDAKGQSVPITQIVTTSSITITVDTSNVTAWPVIADPEYHGFWCKWPGQSTTLGTAQDYLSGDRCPIWYDVHQRGYYPQWIKNFDRWRVGKPTGDCSYIPERLDTWRPQSVVESLISLGLNAHSIATVRIPMFPGVVYDYNQACKGHDYCYDLGHARRMNYANIVQSDCDNIMYKDMKHDCKHRNILVRYLCYFIADEAFKAVQDYGSLTEGWRTPPVVAVNRS